METDQGERRAAQDHQRIGIHRYCHARAATLMGHKDPSILHNHYKALVLKSEAEKYWNLRSELVVGSHVIVYCLAGTTGWGSTFEGRPTVLWKPLSKPLVQSYTYTTNNGAITITKYTGFGGAVTSSIGAFLNQ